MDEAARRGDEIGGRFHQRIFARGNSRRHTRDICWTAQIAAARALRLSAIMIARIASAICLVNLF
jgi:hypothetical protein